MKTNYPYILMLEDDNDDRLITQMFFKERGYDVALEFLAASSDVLPYLERCLIEHRQLPQLVVLDRNAPGGDSIDALKRIKIHHALKVIPVIMISGTAFPADIRDCYALGANSFIAKPFNSEQTAKKIGTFLTYWFDVVEPSIAGVSIGTLS